MHVTRKILLTTILYMLVGSAWIPTAYADVPTQNQLPSQNLVSNPKTPGDAVEGRIFLKHIDGDSNLGESLAEMDNEVVVKIEYKNKTNVEIIGTRSKIQIKNIFERTVYEFTAEQEIDLPPGSDFKSPGTVYSFKKGFGNDEYQALFSLAQSKKYKAIVTPELIIFGDGSSLETSKTTKKK